MSDKVPDQQFQLLIDMSKEMAVNTSSTIKIEAHLKELNGKVASHSKEISKLQRVLLIVGTATMVLLTAKGSDLVKIVSLLI